MQAESHTAVLAWHGGWPLSHHSSHLYQNGHTVRSRLILLQSVYSLIWDSIGIERLNVNNEKEKLPPKFFRFFVCDRYLRDSTFTPKEDIPTMLDTSSQRMRRTKPELLHIHLLQANTTVYGWLFVVK